MRILQGTVLIVSALALAACKSQPVPSSAIADEAAASAAEDAKARAAAHAATMITEAALEAGTAPVAAPKVHAQLQPTQGSEVSGTVNFAMKKGVLRASGQVSGLQPGTTHGFHIHEKGDCSAADGSSAGGHFNPVQLPHGNVAALVHHGGDMLNIVADAQGNAPIDSAVSYSVKVGGGDAFDILGRAVIVHADPDDYQSQPAGNAGKRLACGIIVVSP